MLPPFEGPRQIDFRRYAPDVEAIDDLFHGHRPGRPENALPILERSLAHHRKDSPDWKHSYILKILALNVTGRPIESYNALNEIKPGYLTEFQDLTLLATLYSGTGRRVELAKFYNDSLQIWAGQGIKVHEGIAFQALMANFLCRNWQDLHAIALKMSKMPRKTPTAANTSRYFYWSIQFLLMQLEDLRGQWNPKEATLRAVGLKLLEQRPMTYDHPDFIHVIISALEEFGNTEAALAMAEKHFDNGLLLQEKARELWRKHEKWSKLFLYGKKGITEGSENFAHHLAVLDACRNDPERRAEAMALFNTESRACLIARMQLHMISDDHSAVAETITRIFELYSQRRVCFEDIKPGLAHLIDFQAVHLLDALLKKISTEPPKAEDLTRFVNIRKVVVFTGTEDTFGPLRYIEIFLDGKNDSIECAEDLIFLAVDKLVRDWSCGGPESMKPIYTAICALHLLLRVKPDQRVARLWLCRLYRLVCAPSLAFKQWQAIGAKSIMRETLSHWMFTRASMFCMIWTDEGQRMFDEMCCVDKSSPEGDLWHAHEEESLAAIQAAALSDNLSQVSGLNKLHQRIESSLDRDAIRVEKFKFLLLSTRIDGTTLGKYIAGMADLYKSKSERKVTYDNRDYGGFGHYGPHGLPTFQKMTILESNPTQGWIDGMLHAYARILGPQMSLVTLKDRFPFKCSSIEQIFVDLTSDLLRAHKGNVLNCKVYEDHFKALLRSFEDHESLKSNPWRYGLIASMMLESWSVTEYVIRARISSGDWLAVSAAIEPYMQSVHKILSAQSDDRARDDLHKQISEACEPLLSLCPGRVDENTVSIIAQDIVKSRSSFFATFKMGMARRTGILF